MPRARKLAQYGWIALGAGAAGLLLLLADGWLPRLGLSEGRHRTRPVVVYGFTVLEDVLKQGIFPTFQRTTNTADQVRFIGVFDSLGRVTNELIHGAPADIALLSPEFGARQLMEAGIVHREGWERLPQRGLLTQTPVIIVVRPGNPLGIMDFEDLARPGIKLVHGDPKTSGGGYWAVLAEHGAGWRRAGRWQDGYEQLLGIWKNVAFIGASAREARALFAHGLGDALITYEQDALWAIRKEKVKGEIRYPRSTIMCEILTVVLEGNLEREEHAAITELTEFLWSPTAQAIFLEYGFRGYGAAAAADSSRFPAIDDPFRIEDLGGWTKVRSEIINSWQQAMAKLGR